VMVFMVQFGPEDMTLSCDARLLTCFATCITSH